MYIKELCVTNTYTDKSVHEIFQALEMDKEQFAVWCKEHQLYTSPSVPTIIKYKRTCRYVLDN